MSGYDRLLYTPGWPAFPQDAGVTQPGAVAEFEHALMFERTLDGLAAARACGRTGGQKLKLTSRQARIARQMYEETGPDGRRRYTVAQIAAEFGATRPPIYRHLSRAS